MNILYESVAKMKSLWDVWLRTNTSTAAITAQTTSYNIKLVYDGDKRTL